VTGAQGRQGAAGPSLTDAPVLSVGSPAPAFGPTGTIRATSTITANYSDGRLKDIIGPIPNPLNKIENIRGVYYTNNELAKQFGYQSADRQVGVIAQEIQEVLPEIVVPAPFDIDKYGESLSGENYQTVMYDRLLPLLIEALKEQKRQIDFIKLKLNS
jgi:hypothetical protein